MAKDQDEDAPGAPDVEDAADELYGLHPDHFVPRRTELVKAARAAKDRAAADAIGALRKPSLGAWLANVLARESPDEVAALEELGASMRTAQEELSGDALRTLTRQRRELVGALVARARRLARADGVGVGDSVARDLENTIAAALADDGAARAFAAGRLTSALEPGVGFSGGVEPSRSVRRPPPPRGSGPAHRPPPRREPSPAPTRPGPGDGARAAEEERAARGGAGARPRGGRAGRRAGARGARRRRPRGRAGAVTGRAGGVRPDRGRRRRHLAARAAGARRGRGGGGPRAARRRPAGPRGGRHRRGRGAPGARPGRGRARRPGVSCSGPEGYATHLRGRPTCRVCPSSGMASALAPGGARHASERAPRPAACALHEGDDDRGAGPPDVRRRRSRTA